MGSTQEQFAFGFERGHRERPDSWLFQSVSSEARWKKTWSLRTKWCSDWPIRPIIAGQEERTLFVGDIKSGVKDRGIIKVPENPSYTHLPTSFLDEKVRRIDQPCRFSKSQWINGIGSPCRVGPGPHLSRRAANQCRSHLLSAAWKSAVSTLLALLFLAPRVRQALLGLAPF